MIVMCSLRAMLLLWVVCFAESGLCGEEEFLSNDIGRQVYMTNLHVEKAKSGRRITKGNYRVFVLLEREHFKGNTAQRGWVTGDPSPKLAFPDVFTLPVRREDQLKTTLRWTLEVRNGSTASWKREGSSETPLSKMIGEDAEQHPFCMPLHHKRVPPRNYRRDPRDHAICMDVHDIGSNTFPPETALFTTPLEMVFGSCLGTMLVIWLLSGWAAGTAVQKPLKLVYLVPLGALGFVLWSRMQGIERVTQGRITLSNFEWGFDATGYGTDVEQDYHFELAISFPDGRNYTTNSTTVTAQAASRSPELFPWPNVIGWDYSPDALEATVQVHILAPGLPMPIPSIPIPKRIPKWEPLLAS